jgi:hypothetical protein
MGTRTAAAVVAALARPDSVAPGAADDPAGTDGGGPRAGVPEQPGPPVPTPAPAGSTGMLGA